MNPSLFQPHLTNSKSNLYTVHVYISYTIYILSNHEQVFLNCRCMHAYKSRWKVSGIKKDFFSKAIGKKYKPKSWWQYCFQLTIINVQSINILKIYLFEKKIMHLHTIHLIQCILGCPLCVNLLNVIKWYSCFLWIMMFKSVSPQKYFIVPTHPIY